MRWLKTYPREIQVFLFASLIQSAGGSLMWPLVTLFVYQELDRPMRDAGFVVLLQSLGGIVGQLLGGTLYHRLGVKKLIVGSVLLNGLLLFMLPLVSDNWHLFMGTMVLIGLFNSMSMPAIQAFIGFRFADRRGELFNIVYVANNIGVALGTALCGILADISFYLSFILNGVSCVLFAGFFYVYLNRIGEGTEAGAPIDENNPGRPKAEKGESTIWLLGQVRVYLFMGIGTLFLWLANSIWNTGVSPFIVSSGMLISYYSLLWTLNGVLIFVGQPVVNLVRRLVAQTSQAQLTASAVFYLLGYMVILGFHNYPAFIAAMILITFGEMLMSPAIPSFVSERTGAYAPFYLGVAGGIGAVGRVIGPYVMGIFYDQGGLIPVGWVAVIAGVLSLVFYMVHSVAQRGVMLRPRDQA
ncbi:MFS transporter [Paenibacillus shenyangensis]|uniref:MFS transporter n=1 Tax=Paenibacillus sp. A9 TaxID=1284352 RepID=UPI000365FB23|nr:MFS transporter [Paenibacillus sp. A9]